MTRISRCALLLAVLPLWALSSSPGDLEREIPVTTWQAPPFWSPAHGSAKSAPASRSSVQAPSDLTTPMPFVAVSPCRIVNTRRMTSGEFDAPALVALTERTFTLPNGPCPGLPSDAAAWSLNITAVPAGIATYGGYLSVYPAGSTRPIVSTLNFLGGTTVPPVGNAAIVPAGPNGAITVFPSDATHLLIDVNGYYLQGGIVNGIRSGATTLTGTVTLAAGSNVTITPVWNDLTISTSIPEGPAGPKGDPGPEGPAGATGSAGPRGPAGLTWRGEWASGNTYDMTDAVAHLGSAYVSTTSGNTGNEPQLSAQWSLLAAKGDPGATGTSGPDGPQGPQGPVGPLGPQGPEGPPGSGITTGMVAFFALSACPIGWTDYAAAGGRYVVGVQVGGTIEGVAGAALSNLENRPTGSHDHPVTDPGHSHNMRLDGWGVYSSSTYVYRPGNSDVPTTSSKTGITVIPPAGSVGGTNAPYIQLLVCRKD